MQVASGLQFQLAHFSPVIYQVKKIISQVLVLYWGIHFFSPTPLRGFGFCREKKSTGRPEFWSLGSASYQRPE